MLLLLSGDSLGYHKDMPFSTKDADHDNEHKNDGCAVQYHGAWWFNACQRSHLNGRYYQAQETVPGHRGIQWLSWKGSHYSLQSVNMKMRPAGFKPGEDSGESESECSFIWSTYNIHYRNIDMIINPIGPRILLKHAFLFPGFLANFERYYLFVLKNS